MIIGLTGKNASGKGEVAEFLKKRSFEYHSLSDVIRDELKQQGKSVTRTNLLQTGNELRGKYGSSVLAERILKQLEPDKNYVIDSFRNPSEAEAFRIRNDFALIQVTASPEIRFKRIKERKRESDPQTYEEFLELEEKEAHSADPMVQLLDKTAAGADHKIQNNGTFEELKVGITQLVQELSRKLPRPDWDEYFMGIARVVALRSNCIKRKVAAVVVKDRRIISTGYNGTPRGVKNCNEGGCPRCNSLAESGQDLDKCFCNHAEENAITQSAYHGGSLKDALLYTTFSPCLHCTKIIINSGIVEVVYKATYAIDETSLNLLKEAGIKTRQI
jgi:dCMP deaminase